MPRLLGHPEPPPEEKIVLHLFGLRYVDRAHQLLEHFVSLVKLAADRYKAEDGALVLRRTDLTEVLGLSDGAINCLSDVVLRDGRFLGSGTSDPASWEREISDTGLVPFLDVENIDDYLTVEANLVLGPRSPHHEHAARMMTKPPGTTIFLVHGHDDAAKHSVARFLERITEPPVVILEEQPDRGRTIIEKFEEHAAEAGYAVVLLTGDDEGRELGSGAELRPRARQNVILELGFFVGTLGRGRVTLLYDEGVELPSDIGGVLYLALDPQGAWKRSLAREMSAAGIAVDAQAVLRA